MDRTPESKPETSPVDGESEGGKGMEVEEGEGDEGQLSIELEEILKTCDQIQKSVGSAGGGTEKEGAEPGQCTVVS